MTTLCQMCGHQIPEERVRRSSRTCSKECQIAYRRDYAAAKREKYRKLAGKPRRAENTILAQTEGI